MIHNDSYYPFIWFIWFIWCILLDALFYSFLIFSSSAGCTLPWNHFKMRGKKSRTNERWKLSNLGVLRLFKTQEEDEWLGQILAIQVSFLRICANEIQSQHVNTKQTEGTSAKVKSELFSCPGIHCCTFTNFNKLRWNVRSLRYDVGFSMHTSGLQSIASRWIGRHINPGNIRFRSTDQVSQPGLLHGSIVSFFLLLRVLKLYFWGAVRTWVYLSNWNSRDIWQHNWVPPLLCPEGQNVQKVRRIVNLGCHLTPCKLYLGFSMYFFWCQKCW